MSEIKTETKQIQLGNAQLAAEELVARAATCVKPDLNTYLGSFALHVYQQGSVIDTRTFNFATHFVGDVPEYLAVEAAKELKTRMLERYGHKLKQLPK